MLKINCLYLTKRILNIYNEDLSFIACIDKNVFFLVTDYFYSDMLSKGYVSYRILLNDQQSILVLQNNDYVIGDSLEQI